MENNGSDKHTYVVPYHHGSLPANELVDAEIGVDEDSGRNEKLEEAIKDGVVAELPVESKVFVEGRKRLGIGRISLYERVYLIKMHRPIEIMELLVLKEVRKREDGAGNEDTEEVEDFLGPLGSSDHDRKAALGEIHYYGLAILLTCFV